MLSCTGQRSQPVYTPYTPAGSTDLFTEKVYPRSSRGHAAPRRRRQHQWSHVSFNRKNPTTPHSEYLDEFPRIMARASLPAALNRVETANASSTDRRSKDFCGRGCQAHDLSPQPQCEGDRSHRKEPGSALCRTRGFLVRRQALWLQIALVTQGAERGDMRSVLSEASADD